ncbi:MAG: alpha/beta hydrolase [Heyndrickxia sp.]
MTDFKPTIEELSLQSAELNAQMNLMVYLPPQYSPLYTYPLIIVQDGQDYFNLGRVATLAERLISNKKIRKAIIVGIPYTNKQERWHRYHPNGENQEAYIRFLVRELLPAVSEQYAVEELASDRYLIGDSLGATVSLTACLRYPHTFGNAILQSPFVDNALIEKVSGFSQASQISVYHSIGKNETEVETTWGERADFLEPNHRLRETFIQKSFASYVYEENEGNHTWTYWQSDVEQALIKMIPKE